MKTEQPALFDLNQYQAKQSNIGDWSLDVAGDVDEAWDIRTDATDAIANCGSCRHFDSGQRFCEKLAIRFKSGESLLDRSECGHYHSSAENDSITPPPPPVIESKLIETDDKDSDTANINDSITPHGAVTRYESGGTARGFNVYFRYSYRDNGKVRHIHIPGGNTANPIAQQRVEIIQRAINEGRSHTEICQRISNWQRKAKVERSQLQPAQAKHQHNAAKISNHCDQ